MNSIKQTIVPFEGLGLVSDSNRFKSNKGEISMITPCMGSMNMYEIYSLECNLFDDIERYSTEEEVYARIYELLG